MVSAARYERSGKRLTWRNGYRDGVLDTLLGSLHVCVPKLWQSSYFLPFLEVRKASEEALNGAIQETWIGGVSAWCVDEPVHLVGLSRVKSVAIMCNGDERFILQIFYVKKLAQKLTVQLVVAAFDA
jgi:putative transposase